MVIIWLLYMVNICQYDIWWFFTKKTSIFLYIPLDRTALFGWPLASSGPVPPGEIAASFRSFASDPPGWFSGDLGPCGLRRGLPGSAGSVAGYPWEALEKSWLVQRPWDMDGYHWSTLLVLWRGLSSKSQMNIFFNHQYDMFFSYGALNDFWVPLFLVLGKHRCCQPRLRDVRKIQSTWQAFAALWPLGWGMLGELVTSWMFSIHMLASSGIGTRSKKMASITQHSVIMDWFDFFAHSHHFPFKQIKQMPVLQYISHMFFQNFTGDSRLVI